MLAIIIPYYNLTFFEETLQSLNNQSNKQFKVYIGNDASNEDPAILLEKYRDKFDFNYHRFEENLGSKSLVKQWERCIALSANEEWIMILGDDDVLGSNVIEEFYNNLKEIEKEKIDVVRFATKVIDGQGNIISRTYDHPKIEKATEGFWRKLTGKTRSSLSEYIFSRKSFTTYRFREYPLAWHTDDMMWLEFSNFENILSVNSASLLIRKSESSISGREDNNSLKLKASILFFKDLIKEKLHLFKWNQRYKLLLILEQNLKANDEIQFSDWLFLLKMYLFNFKIIPSLKLIRRMCLSYYRN